MHRIRCVERVADRLVGPKPTCGSGRDPLTGFRSSPSQGAFIQIKRPGQKTCSRRARPQDSGREAGRKHQRPRVASSILRQSELKPTIDGGCAFRLALNRLTASHFERYLKRYLERCPLLAMRAKSLKNGGRTWARTKDPLIKSQLLYQLSYASIREVWRGAWWRDRCGRWPVSSVAAGCKPFFAKKPIKITSAWSGDWCGRSTSGCPDTA